MIDHSSVRDLDLAYKIQQAFQPIGIWGPDIYINCRAIVVSPQNNHELHRILRNAFLAWALEVENARG